MPARKATEEEQKKWWVESEVGQITCLHLPFKLLVENTLTDLISEGDKLAQEIENTPEHISGITLVGDAGPETNLREVRFGTTGKTTSISSRK